MMTACAAAYIIHIMMTACAAAYWATCGIIYQIFTTIYMMLTNISTSP